MALQAAPLSSGPRGDAGGECVVRGGSGFERDGVCGGGGVGVGGGSARGEDGGRGKKSGGRGGGRRRMGMGCITLLTGVSRAAGRDGGAGEGGGGARDGGGGRGKKSGGRGGGRRRKGTNWISWLSCVCAAGGPRFVRQSAPATVDNESAEESAPVGVELCVSTQL